jgi:hypothetical protein
MNLDRFNQCLNLLRWTKSELARALECDIFLVNAWNDGTEGIPDGLASWLEALAQAHAELGIPAAYKGWKREPKNTS